MDHIFKVPFDRYTCTTFPLINMEPMIKVMFNFVPSLHTKRFFKSFPLSDVIVLLTNKNYKFAKTIFKFSKLIEYGNYLALLPYHNFVNKNKLFTVILQLVILIIYKFIKNIFLISFYFILLSIRGRCPYKINYCVLKYRKQKCLHMLSSVI